MTDFEPVARTRQAVRQLLARTDCQDVAVAVSGGADSLALAAAASHVAVRSGLTVHGLVVDHQLQPGSADVAATAAEQLHGLGIDDVQVMTVTVTGPGGPEAAARKARYDALRSAGFPLVLLGHTLDDQAETVLLGLGRGSGPRSIAGMRDLDLPWGRPFLSVPRATTVAACEALGLTTWDDPHNVDPAYTRVRLRREVLPLLEDVLQGGVAPALARTAAQLQDDAEALDTLAARLLRTALLTGADSSDKPATAAEPRRGGEEVSGETSLTDTRRGNQDGSNEIRPGARDPRGGAGGASSAEPPRGGGEVSGAVLAGPRHGGAGAAVLAGSRPGGEGNAGKTTRPSSAPPGAGHGDAARAEARRGGPGEAVDPPGQIDPGQLDVAVLSAEPAALRRRVLRRWLLDAGVRELTDAHLRSVDALIGAWRGQGDVWLPGNFAVGRARGRLRVTARRERSGRG